MQVLIVDDEPLSRKTLAKVLSERKDIELLDMAKDAVDAMGMLEAKSYDILLLDIQMPELSGIELAERLQAKQGPFPAIVFVTAHQQHALAAFEKHAVDYVLKPFSSARIHAAVNAAAQRAAGERAAGLMKVLPQMENLFARAPKIAIKAKGRILFIDPSEIIVVEAQGNYVLLQKQSGSYLLRESISTIAETLKPYGFIRIHRSVLVNASFVEEIQPWSTGEYVLRITSGKEFTVTRTFKRNLKAIASLWIGTESFARN